MTFSFRQKLRNHPTLHLKIMKRTEHMYVVKSEPNNEVDVLNAYLGMKRKNTQGISDVSVFFVRKKIYNRLSEI